MEEFRKNLVPSLHNVVCDILAKDMFYVSDHFSICNRSGYSHWQLYPTRLYYLITGDRFARMYACVH